MTPSRPTAPPARAALRRAGATALALAAALAAGCSGEAPRPNVLLISVDTLRQDHVGAYGYPRPTTPALDRLAAEGALFENAYSTSAWTLPAHVSAFTGLLPSVHAVEDEGDALAASVPTLAESFRAAGYRTGGVASHVFLGPEYGFDRGFARYSVDVDQPAAAVTRRALDWLAAEESAAGQPFFLFLHYFDPHWDYAPPERHLRRFARGEVDRRLGTLERLLAYARPDEAMAPAARQAILDLYDGEIAYADEQIGRVVEALRERGDLDSTVVVVFADHGEEIRDHGSFGHGGSLYAESIRVPLVVRYPAGVAAGARARAAVSLADLPATLAALAGVPALPAPPGAGRDLSPLMRRRGGDGPPPAGLGPSRIVLAESTRLGPKRVTAMNAGWRYQTASHYDTVHAVTTPRGGHEQLAQRLRLPAALYDLRRDRAERRNALADTPAPAPLARLQRAVVDHLLAHERALFWALLPSPAARRLALHLPAPPRDEPYVLATGAAGATEVAAQGAVLAAQLAPSAAEGGWLVVPLAGAPGKVEARLAGSEGEVARTLEPPGGGRTVEVAELGTLWWRSGDRRGGEAALSEEKRRQLRALGYTGGGAATAPASPHRQLR